MAIEKNEKSNQGSSCDLAQHYRDWNDYSC